MEHILFLYRKFDGKIRRDRFFREIEKVEGIGKFGENQWVYNSVDTDASFCISMESKDKGGRFEGYRFVEASISVEMGITDNSGRECFDVIDSLLENMDLFVVSDALCDTPTRFEQGKMYSTWSEHVHQLLDQSHYHDDTINQEEERTISETPEQRLRRLFDTDEEVWAKAVQNEKRKIVLSTLYKCILVIVAGLLKVRSKSILINVLMIIGALVVAFFVLVFRMMSFESKDEKKISALKDKVAKKQANS